MPKRKRHKMGNYKPKSFINDRCFNGIAPLTLFQSENGLWGVKDGLGNIEIKAEYHIAPQTEEEKACESRRLIHYLGDEVILISPYDWSLICYLCLD